MGLWEELFGPPIDTGSRRWVVAMHEAGHVEAARALGWDVEYAVIHEGGDSGVMSDEAPPGLDETDRDVQSAIISIAGLATSNRWRLFLPSGCETDERDARATLKGTGVRYGDARREAERLVSRRWGAIKKTARHLYHHGSL